MNAEQLSHLQAQQYMTLQSVAGAVGGVKLYGKYTIVIGLEQGLHDADAIVAAIRGADHLAPFKFSVQMLDSGYVYIDASAQIPAE